MPVRRDDAGEACSMGGTRRLPGLRRPWPASSPERGAVKALCSMPETPFQSRPWERPGSEGGAVSRGPKYTPAEDAAIWDACHRRRVDRIRDLARELGRSRTGTARAEPSPRPVAPSPARCPSRAREGGISPLPCRAHRGGPADRSTRGSERTLEVDRVMRAAGAVERVMGLDGWRTSRAKRGSRE